MKRGTEARIVAAMEAEIKVLEKRAGRLRQAIKVVLDGSRAVAGRAPAGPARKGHTRKRCALRTCGRGFVGRRNAMFCCYAHGAKERALKLADARVAPAPAKPKPTTLLRGDALSAAAGH